MARAKTLTKADQQLWAAFTQDLLLMPGKTRLPLAPDPPPPTPDPPPSAKPVPPNLPSTPQPRIAGPDQPPRFALAQPSGLDASTWKNFATGKLPTRRRLDLHGLTAARAHHAVTHFLERAYAEQIRCVEIITGNGEILARELPHWLNAPTLRQLILAGAHPHASNTGAVRLLLRRLR